MSVCIPLFTLSEFITFKPCLTKLLLISDKGTRSHIVANATKSKY